MPAIAANEGRYVARLTIHSVDHCFTKRIRALREGLISYNHGATVMGCSILDFAGNGARLRPQDTVFVPDRFRLRLSRTLTIGCEVTDRGASEIGVAFVGP
jgi:hypothetical protein